MLETISSLEISEINYAVALELLENRFANRRLVFQAHVTDILGLRVVQSGSVSKFCDLLGTVKQIAGCIIVQLLAQMLDPASQAKYVEHLEDPAGRN